jgi:hypothetical protein
MKGLHERPYIDRLNVIIDRLNVIRSGSVVIYEEDHLAAIFEVQSGRNLVEM